MNYFTANSATAKVAKQRSSRDFVLTKLSQQIVYSITLDIKSTLEDMNSSEDVNCVEVFKPRSFATLCFLAKSMVETENSDIRIDKNYLESEDNFLPLMHKVQSLLIELGYEVEFVWEKVMPENRGMRRKILLSIDEANAIADGTYSAPKNEYSPMKEKPKSDYSNEYESKRIITCTFPEKNQIKLRELMGSIGINQSHFDRPDGGRSDWMPLRPSMNVRWPEPTEQEIENVLNESLGQGNNKSLDNSWDSRLQHIG